MPKCYSIVKLKNIFMPRIREFQIQEYFLTPCSPPMSTESKIVLFSPQNVLSFAKAQNYLHSENTK